ncbi:glycosyltransferase family 4 protein [candidate division KSB1 bacterium]|nr:glycosyltransferase family 4 protein [candidate division KSB1 bacterium]
MKLTFINIMPLWGGGELWTFQTALEFVRRGHEVSVIAAENGKLLKKINVTNISSIPIPSSLWKRFSVIRYLKHLIKTDPPHLWVANSGQDIRLANRIQPLRKKIPLIFRRGLDKPLGNHIFHRRAFENVDLIIANSYATRKTIADSFTWFPKENIRTIHNSINAGAFLSYPPRNIREELAISVDTFVIGIIARLTKQKGHQTLFNALPKILEVHPNTKLLIVGDGELKTGLQNQAAQMGIAAVCKFVGHVEIVQPYYEACDVIVIPSIFEGFCFTALEAQLMGKLVVASNTSSLPEIVADNQSGFLVPVNDADAFAHRIIQLETDPSLRKRMGNAGRQIAQTKFSATVIYDQLEALFKSIL